MQNMVAFPISLLLYILAVHPYPVLFMKYPLIFRPSEFQGDVFLFEYELAVNEVVDKAQHFVCVLRSVWRF